MKTADGSIVVAKACGEDGSAVVLLLPSGTYELRPSYWDEEGEPYPTYATREEAVQALRVHCGI